MRSLLNRLILPRPAAPVTERVSYAQCGEDLIVDFMLSCCGVSKGVYLDIGANDPVMLSNTYLFYKKDWRGFNVEPQADKIAHFRCLRRQDVNIEAGIGRQSGTFDFYCVDPPTLSTFDKNIAESYQKMGHAITSTVSVKLLSPADLMAAYDIPRDIDLLSIDIEGGELAIIEALLEAGLRPKALICETIDYTPDLRQGRKNAELIARIVALNYTVYADTFINTIFVDKGFWRQPVPPRVI